MSLLQNINKKTSTVAATAVAVLVGGVGVSFALTALPNSKNESPVTTLLDGTANETSTSSADSAVVVPPMVEAVTSAAPTAGAGASAGTVVTPSPIGSSATSANAVISTNESTSALPSIAPAPGIGSPPAAGISNPGGDDDDDDHDDHDDDDDDHDDHDDDDDDHDEGDDHDDHDDDHDEDEGGDDGDDDAEDLQCAEGHVLQQLQLLLGIHHWKRKTGGDDDGAEDQQECQDLHAHELRHRGGGQSPDAGGGEGAWHERAGIGDKWSVLGVWQERAAPVVN